METTIKINNLTKKFGDVVAINDVSLEIDPGSFLTLLGPSGCGKTTLLRCIAGLEEPDGGEIYIGDKLVFSYDEGISLPPGQRELGLVFQNYALWPHMKVDKNITFALLHFIFGHFLDLKRESNVLIHLHMRPQSVILEN